MKLKSLLDYNGEGYRERMTGEQTEQLLNLCLIDMRHSVLDEAPDDIKKLIEADRMCQIFYRRLRHFGVDASPAAIMFCAMNSENLGTLVMWAYTYTHLAERFQKGRITLEELTLGFPLGFPTEKAKRECWEAQKVKSDFSKGITDNGMDNVENWQWEGYEKLGNFSQILSQK